jgi:hypothetical protein
MKLTGERQRSSQDEIPPIEQDRSEQDLPLLVQSVTGIRRALNAFAVSLEHVRTEMRQHNLGAFDLATEAHGHPLGVGDGGRKERCV